MKKRLLTDDELNNVIVLKQRKYSWLRIQNETRIPRQAAKRAYEIWVSSRAMEELKNARVNVATQEFQRHLDDICVIARALVENLPNSILLNEKRDSAMVVDEIWHRDFHDKGEELSAPEDMFRRKSEPQQRYIVRENRLVFESLQAHLREKMGWRAFQEWKTQWNAGVRDQQAIKDAANKLLMNILNNREKEVKKINFRGYDMRKLICQMTNGIGEAVWRGILAEKPEEAYTFVRNESKKDGTIHIFFGSKASIEDITLKDEAASELVKEICTQAVNIICKGKIPTQALEINRQLKSMVDELEVMLSQVMLRSLILRTRCDLCPA